MCRQKEASSSRKFMVSDGWHSNKCILDADDFIDVEFETVPTMDDASI